MSPLGATVISMLCILIMTLPKKYLSLPFFLTIYFLASGEMIEVGGFALFGHRIVLLFAALRMLTHKDKYTAPLQNFELVFLAGFLWTAISIGIRLHSVNAMLNAGSAAFEGFITYLFARSSFDDAKQFKTAGIIFGVLMLPLCILLIAERFTYHNYFSVFNGVSPIPTVRNGEIRASGAFGHAILAGTAAAVHLPMVIRFYNEKKVFTIIGSIAILGVVYASNSSGPIMTTLFGGIALSLWFKKERISNYRTKFYILLILLEIERFVVNGGHVWDYMARIDLTGSSTGWHRAHLITSWLNHFSEWWLLGTDHTRHWMGSGVSFNPNHTDLTNQFIALAVNGGLGPLCIFIFMIYRSFKNIGFCITNSSSTDNQLSFWVLGTMLFAHVATFFSVGYFDKTMLVVYYLLGVISALYVKRDYYEA